MISYQNITKEIKNSGLNNKSKKVLLESTQRYYNENIIVREIRMKYTSDSIVKKAVDDVSIEIGMFKKDGCLDYNFVSNNSISNDSIFKLLKNFKVNESKIIINKIAAGKQLKEKELVFKQILKQLGLIYNNNFNYNKDVIKLLITNTVKFSRQINSYQFRNKPLSQW